MAVVLESMQLQVMLATDTLRQQFVDLHSAVDLGQVAVGHHLRRLVANTNLEASRAPVDELNRALRLECGNCAVGILGDNISTVKHAGGHVLAVARITLDHLVVRLEAGHGDFVGGIGFMSRLGG